ncbi:rubrerythrin-like domain-containing protein [Salinarchaeum sp. IM2453]|nr:rubrerythrin-like domain-containing protein [Salinarchaeum sp. IM2453]QZA88898.1 rubrerythrin-like domain-containing protein [Salinarchaeum sp. IM2453]
MPQPDPEYDPAEESEYECLDCGNLIEETDPSNCPECGGTLRNRSLPME